MNTFCIRLSPGQDLKEELDSLARKESWSAACILTCVGSLDSAAIRFADAKQIEILKGPFEIISLSGTLSQDGSHLHILISDAEGIVKGGHLREGAIIRTTGEIVIAILPDWKFNRSIDSNTGFLELDIKGPS